MVENWGYNDKEDSSTHPGGRDYRFYHIKYQKTQTDFQQEIKVYYADEPESPPFKKDGISTNAINT